MLVCSTAMLATGVLAWTTIPAHSTPTTALPAPPPAPKPPPPPPPDHSHFQAGKTLMVEGRLGHAVLPANVDNETLVFVDVTGGETGTAKAPIDLSIVIDKSGSMAGKRMVNAIAAAKTSVQRLRDGDIVSVIAFNTAVDVVVKPTVVDATNRNTIINQLATIHAGGDTCISCGIDSAMSLLEHRSNLVDHVLLLSDGQPTAGVRDVDGFRRIAENCRRMGASVSTIGVDVGYDEHVMGTLARDSNGHHFFAADPSALPSIFDQEMLALTRTVANGAELTIDLAPGVVVQQVFDRTNTGSGSHIVVPFGSFSAGEHKTLLARVRLPRGTVGERAIAAVHLRYDDLVDAKPGLCEGQLATRLTSQSSELTPLDGLVSARESATETAQVLETANGLFNEGKADDARGLIMKQQEKLAAAHSAAKIAAPAARQPDLDARFDENATRLDGAGSGFMTKPTAMKPGEDKAGQAQVRQNQAGALDATE
jgi:Ca-activated chloride channel family protein